jgi:hypothetical protein
MGVFLIIEASKPCGGTYSLGLGCFSHLKLASVVATIARLF